MVTSPYLEVHELISSYVAGTTLYVPSYKIKRALIKGQYDIYPGEQNIAVRNIFAIDDETETTPLLGLRLLELLRDAHDTEDGDSFITVDQAIEYFRAMLIDPNVITAWLSQLLKAGLCLSYDPTVTDIRQTGKVEISPAGLQHLHWGTRDSDYVQAMLEVTPLTDRAVFDQLILLARQPHGEVWRDKLECFLEYLISEDVKQCKIPDHEAYLTQEQLVPELRRMLHNR
jgi:hypothetical protein